MKTYPISLELTAWIELGINQYEITIDETSTLSVKRTDDVLHTRELTSTEVSSLVDSILAIEIPLLECVNAKSTKPSSSFELIIESAHFSVEFNWEDLDIQTDQSGALISISHLAQLVENIGQFH
jgi:hypothetical protein